jgi:ABC-type lipoprotein export system ATPase subunit
VIRLEPTIHEVCLELRRVSSQREMFRGRLADEPTGALDTNTRDAILAILAQLQGDGLTLVLVTHDPEVARCARRMQVVVQKIKRLANYRLVDSLLLSTTSLPTCQAQSER